MGYIRNIIYEYCVSVDKDMNSYPVANTSSILLSKQELCYMIDYLATMRNILRHCCSSQQHVHFFC